MSIEKFVKRNVKDSVFCDMFSRPEFLLKLYKALHPEDTTTTVDGIRAITLNTVLTNGVYNDLGFMANNSLIMLVEAQSTWSKNIVIRSLLYISDTLKSYFAENGINLYSETKAVMPNIEMYVVYTGDRNISKAEISLADDFYNGEETPLNLKVKVITKRDNKDILEEYIQFCKISSSQIKKHGRTKDVLCEIIDFCKKEDILREYLTGRESEVMDIMDILFDQEIVLAAYLNEEKNKSMEIGVSMGVSIGENNKLVSLIKKKLTKNKSIECIADELEEDTDTIRKLIEKIKNNDI